MLSEVVFTSVTLMHDVIEIISLANDGIKGGQSPKKPSSRDSGHLCGQLLELLWLLNVRAILKIRILANKIKARSI